jgi:FkbM family methyltransferase
MAQYIQIILGIIFIIFIIWFWHNLFGPFYIRKKTSFSPSFDKTILATIILRNKTINYIKNDTCIGSSLKNGNYWELWMLKYIKENYIENTNIIDLGGNIGTTTLLMTEVLSNNCHIFTFEPIYSDILLTNILDNNLSDKVIIYPYGVGNKNKLVKIKNISLTDTINFGGVSIINNSDNSDNKNNIIKINIYPLDYFNFDNISLIKIDVEHMELEVLEGCISLLKRCKPTILIETYQIDKLKNTDVFKQLTMIGYTIDPIPEGHFDFIMKIK